MSALLSSLIFSTKISKYLPKHRDIGIGSRKKSFNSVSWLKRREVDPYIELARKENYRCRSAFKLIQICDKYNLVKPGFRVLDLGAAPGSWSQVLAKRTNSNFNDKNNQVGLVIAVDLGIICPIKGVISLSQSDFIAESTQNKILEILGENEKFDFIFSDMAPQSTGIKSLDRERITNLIYPVILFSIKHLKLSGGCLIKVWDGAENSVIKEEIIKFFLSCKFIKPQASYSSSSEIYILLKNFVGIKKIISSELFRKSEKL